MIVISDFLIFLKSFVAGLAICLPIGPISIVVIRKAIKFNVKKAFLTGVGSATADIFYGTIATTGFIAIARFLFKSQQYVQLVAALILLIMAIKIYRQKNGVPVPTAPSISLIDDFSVGFFLALFNPMTLFFMTTLLSAFGVPVHTGFSINTIIAISGLFVGELCWWFGLARLVGWARSRFGLRVTGHVINTVAATVLFVLSLLIIIKTVFFS